MKGAILFLLAIIIGCSPSKRIKYHRNRLAILELLYPQYFTKSGVDTTLPEKKLYLNTDIKKIIDSSELAQHLKDSAYYKKVADSLVLDLAKKGIKDCDTVIKYKDRLITIQGKIKGVHMASKCLITPKYLDTLGVEIQVMGVNGQVDISVRVDSTKIKKDCPPCNVSKEKNYWQFWQFWFAVSLVFLAIYLKK